MQVPFNVWLVRAGIPLLGVWLALLALLVAAAATLFDLFTSSERHLLFGGAALTWMAGIAWGLWVNRRPLPS